MRRRLHERGCGSAVAGDDGGSLQAIAHLYWKLSHGLHNPHCVFIMPALNFDCLLRMRNTNMGVVVWAGGLN